MREKERRWVKSRIREYYEKSDINVKDIDKREFGVGFWDKKIEQRHLSFNSNDELKGFLIEKAPLYVSYSTSLYKYPDRRPMEKKERMKSELTFDLDGEGSSLRELNKVKEELKKLLKILKMEFGVKEYIINFSGSRGFHLHVYDEEFSYLSSRGRKKIVDYLLGNFDYEKFFDIKEGVLYGPKLGDRGLKGRFVEKLLEILENDPKIIGRGMEKHKEKWKKALNTGNYGLIPIRSNREIIRKMEKVFNMVRINVDVDAAVTYDISKLIRMPNSIHGGSGFIAKIIKEDEIDKFNPYENAIAFEGDEKVIYLKSFKMIRDGKEIIKKKGEKEKINKAIAFYLIIKGLAIIA